MRLGIIYIKIICYKILLFSAAFCVADSRGNILQEDYIIGAAKYFRQYSANESFTQFAKVSSD